MVIKAHQNPSPAPLMNDRGKSSWLVGESYKNTRNKRRKRTVIVKKINSTNKYE